MHNDVMYELTVFGGAGAAGVLMAFLYDLFRLKRRFVRTKPIAVHIEDVLYWICAAIILFLSSYALSSGETRGYFYAGTFLGAVTYLGLLSRPVIWLLTRAIKILIWPFCEIYKIVKPVLHALHLRCRKTMGKAKLIAAVKGYRVRVNYFRLRNAFTKK